MIWAAPAAWALALLAALPLIAHLWSRRRPARLPFPTLRFLRAASPVSRRLRRVQEWPLLLLRLAIVVVVCAAAAGPTLAAHWRQQAWRARLHRVIVVDADVAGTTESAAVTDLQKTAASSTVLGPADIADALDDAIAQADRSASDCRTELVVVWSGSRTALADIDVADIPARVGVRLVRVDDSTGSLTSAATSTPTGDVDIQTPDAALRASLHEDLRTLRLPPSSTPILLHWAGETAARDAQGAPGRESGVGSRESPSENRAAGRRAGSAAGAGASAECRGAPEPVLRALDEMAADARLRDAADRSLLDKRFADRSADGAAARVLARSAAGQALLRGWAEGGCLVLDLASLPRSPLTWWSLVSAREALARVDRMGPAGNWTAADVARANRDGLAPTDSMLPGGLDTRSAWAVALALLLMEQTWRRRGATARERHDSVPTHAAAREPVDAA